MNNLLMPIDEAAHKVDGRDTGTIPAADRLRIIGAFPDEEFREMRNFAVEESFSACASVNILDVRGTDHPEYMGLSWDDLLRDGKRMRGNLGELRQNPGYYLDTSPKVPAMKFSMINGTLYIAGDGNRRTCIAWHLFRLLGISYIHGVEITEYKIDLAAYSAWKRAADAIARAKRHSVKIEPVRKKLRREDSSGWHREFYGIGLAVQDLQSSSGNVMLGPDGVEGYLDGILRPKGLGGFLKRLGVTDVHKAQFDAIRAVLEPELTAKDAEISVLKKRCGHYKDMVVQSCETCASYRYPAKTGIGIRSCAVGAAMRFGDDGCLYSLCGPEGE